MKRRAAAFVMVLEAATLASLAGAGCERKEVRTYNPPPPFNPPLPLPTATEPPFDAASISRNPPAPSTAPPSMSGAPLPPAPTTTGAPSAKPHSSSPERL